ncbi:MAG TPA: DUF6587 family protein [Steroidobacteraceae bacterium]|nr:DUF6587 family protein [Steroidobacteraceae bacterium]
MNAVLDNFLVGVLLLASVSYAVYKLGPRTLKRRILQTLSRATAAAPVFLKLGRVAQKLDAASAAKVQGACGGCDNCGTESSSEPQPSSAEIKVPVAKIGRRTSAL